jgi:hypothetical protein
MERVIKRAMILRELANPELLRKVSENPSML